jgi:hypothetical protein
MEHPAMKIVHMGCVSEETKGGIFSGETASMGLG